MRPIVTSDIATDNLTLQAEVYLTTKAKEALFRSSIKETIQDADGNIFMTTYFGARVPHSQLEDGIKLVAAEINLLASKGHIHSTLTHFKRLDLSPETTGYFNQFGEPKEQETVVVCYVLVPQQVHGELLERAEKEAKKWFNREECQHDWRHYEGEHEEYCYKCNTKQQAAK